METNGQRRLVEQLKLLDIHSKSTTQTVTDMIVTMNKINENKCHNRQSGRNASSAVVSIRHSGCRRHCYYYRHQMRWSLSSVVVIVGVVLSVIFMTASTFATDEAQALNTIGNHRRHPNYKDKTVRSRNHQRQHQRRGTTTTSTTTTASRGLQQNQQRQPQTSMMTFGCKISFSNSLKTTNEDDAESDAALNDERSDSIGRMDDADMTMDENVYFDCDEVDQRLDDQQQQQNNQNDTQDRTDDEEGGGGGGEASATTNSDSSSSNPSTSPSISPVVQQQQQGPTLAPDPLPGNPGTVPSSGPPVDIDIELFPSEAPVAAAINPMPSQVENGEEGDTNPGLTLSDPPQQMPAMNQPMTAPGPISPSPTTRDPNTIPGNMQTPNPTTVSPTLEPTSMTVSPANANTSSNNANQENVSISEVPSHSPSDAPTTLPPTTKPTSQPSFRPSVLLSDTPSMVPSATPSSIALSLTVRPSVIPSAQPSQTPSNHPSPSPSVLASDVPSSIPSKSPTVKPSASPTLVLSDEPSVVPSSGPSKSPTGTPSIEPTSAVPSSRPSLAPSTTPSPSDSPTGIPTDIPVIDFVEGRRSPGPTPECGVSPDGRNQLIMDKIAELSGREAFDDPKDPIYLATVWLVQGDSMYVCPDDPSLIQRYALALLYYSTNGDDWNRCSRSQTKPCPGANFLTGFNECLWGGVTCDGQGRVTNINLGKCS